MCVCSDQEKCNSTLLGSYNNKKRKKSSINLLIYHVVLANTHERSDWYEIDNYWELYHWHSAQSIADIK